MRRSVACRVHVTVALFLLSLILPPGRTAAAEPEMNIKPIATQLEKLIDDQIKAGMITGVTVAIVHGDEVVYIKGFGLADKRTKRAAKPDTIYRVGSISKLFTAVGAMQLAEQGKLDIDKPVTDYDPQFSIVNPFNDEPVTARQLMCHRSSLIRESPIGSYFDDADPGIEATVRSIRPCVLVYPPNTKNKYSNVGPTVVGLMIEKITGEDFATYQRKHVLGPLGMTSSAWRINDALRGRLSTAYMRRAQEDGSFKEFEAPKFELGTLPAGNLYSTAEDLAKFAICLMANGKLDDGKLVNAGTLKEMFRPQLTSSSNNFGLGFFAGRFNRFRTVSHSGAVYGFSSSFVTIPNQKLAVIVLNNDDINMGPVRKISNTALKLLLEATTDADIPDPAPTMKMTKKQLAPFAGEFAAETYWATIEPGDGALIATISGQRNSLRPIGEHRFEAFGRLAYETFFEFERDGNGNVTGFTGFGQTFTRIDPAKTKPIPDAWQRYLGTYGKDYIPVIVTQRHGRLYAMTENMYDYALTPLNRHVFKLPPGMYFDEELIFHVDANGKVLGMNYSNVDMRRW